DNYGIPTCSLRIFSAYGPGLQKQLFWDLYQKSIKDSTIKLYGTGAESRDFIYISDLVQAIELAIEKALFKSDTINVANGKEVTIAQVAETFFTNTPSEFIFGGEERKGDPSNWVADISQLKTMGYKTKVSLEEGIKNYWQWLKENE
ncbi:MAG TPA: dTDP-glucose 4,6-dehydratase, partial [Flavobacteriaceae bacterium]|nr:dTDP-glucose 4,6-dehydratase [Flavobacteriaceae bacterium]